MPHSHLTEDPIVLLAKAVCKSAGIEVTCTRDCEVLSEELRSFDGRFPVSVSTLRRFFGLIPRKSNFSTNTLNTLARYIGYPSYRNWKASMAPTSRDENLDKTPLPLQEQDHGPAKGSLPPPIREARALTDNPSQWSDEEAKQRVERFIDRFANPDHFHLTAQEFARLKAAVFMMYERGSFDMKLWLKFIEHDHLLRFVVEQFPPLDFMNSFGKDMMNSYLKVASTPSETLFGRGVLAAGLVAKDAPWEDVLPLLAEPSALNPSIHPLVQSRNLGILLLAGSDGVLSDHHTSHVRQLVLDGLRREEEIWPRWSNQNCYFAFNLADWAVLSGDREVVAAINENIQKFKDRIDWYRREVEMDTLLSIREMWNHLFLEEFTRAKILAQQIQWDQFHSMETRTLGLWYHSALWILGLARTEVSKANIQHCASLTGYRGFERRILSHVHASFLQD